MLRNIFLKTFYEHRRGLLWWLIGLAAYAAMIVLFYPAVNQMPDVNQMLEMAPKELMAAFVGEIQDITSPTGYLNSQIFFFLGPLLLIIFAVGVGSGTLAGEEEHGTLDLLLANPLARARVVAEKLAALVVMTLGLAATLWLGLAAGAPLVKMEIAAGRLAEATLSITLLALVFGVLALALGAATGNRGLSLGVTSALAVVTYLLNALSAVVEGLKPYRVLSPFYYATGADPLANGLNWGHAAVLVALVVVFAAAAWLTFERRDLAV